MALYITKNNFSDINKKNNIKIAENFNEYLDLSNYTHITQIEFGWSYNQTINNNLPISLERLELNYHFNPLNFDYYFILFIFIFVLIHSIILHFHYITLVYHYKS